tara:strand:- start:4184 stop:5347 length:1164 start_codon:yes stop_codon:yes gene_type:complete
MRKFGFTNSDWSGGEGKPWWLYAINPTNRPECEIALGGLNMKALFEKNVRFEYEFDGKLANEQELTEIKDSLVSDFEGQLFSESETSSDAYFNNEYLEQVSSRSFTIFWEDAALTISTFKKDKYTACQIQMYYLDTFKFESLQVFLKQKIKKIEESKLHTIMLRSNRLICEQLDIIVEEYLPDNYANDVQEKYSRVKNALLTHNEFGNLMVFEGPPGTGKTFLVKNLITELGDKYCHVLVPSSMVAKLGNPEFIHVLHSLHQEVKKPILLVIEDADKILKTRTDSNLEDISSALNLSDGILGSLLKIKIICTTNVPLTDIDQAVTRSGRLLEHIHIDRLNLESISIILKRELNTDYTDDMLESFKDEKYVLADVYKFISEFKNGKQD